MPARVAVVEVCVPHDVLRELGGVLESHAGAEVVPGEVDLVEAELAGDEVVDVLGEGCLVVARWGSLAVPEPGQIDGVHGVVLGEGRHDRVPRVPGLRPSVQQDQRFAGTARDVVHVHVVDLGGPVPEDPVELVIALRHGVGSCR